ncbi:MAG: universal stress protein [Chloroflexota bacterium]
MLAATAGSAAAGRAIDLVGALAWPPGTEARLVTVLDTVHLAGPWSAAGTAIAHELEGSLRVELHAHLAHEAARLERTGATVTTAILVGRPSGAIADAAAAWGADCIVTGSRGMGAIRTALLGSVCAELVERAPCPVLVARAATVRRILLADDGSEVARGAAAALAAIGPLARLPVEVVSVAEHDEAGPDDLRGADPARLAAIAAARAAATREHHERIARDAADRLSAGGRTVGWTVRTGDPAAAIVDEAEARGADLVALGTHGRSGLDRILLGSVARSVLTHARCSVLVVPHRARRAG